MRGWGPDAEKKFLEFPRRIGSEISGLLLSFIKLSGLFWSLVSASSEQGERDPYM